MVFFISKVGLVDLEINRLTKILFLATLILSVVMLALKVIVCTTLYKLEVFEEYLPRAEYSRDMHRYRLTQNLGTNLTVSAVLVSSMEGPMA